jgi:hypothetical protein
VPHPWTDYLPPILAPLPGETADQRRYRERAAHYKAMDLPEAARRELLRLLADEYRSDPTVNGGEPPKDT